MLDYEGSADIPIALMMLFLRLIDLTYARFSFHSAARSSDPSPDYSCSMPLAFDRLSVRFLGCIIVQWAYKFLLVHPSSLYSYLVSFTRFISVIVHT